MRHRILALAAVVALAGIAQSACSGGGGALTVFAAASLTEPFEEIAEAFERRSPGVEVILNFDASQRLAGQIVAGAPADVFASANLTQMDAVVAAGLTDGAPEAFAENRLAIAVEPGNPRGVAGLADLSRRDLVVVLAAPEVPAGRYAQDALEAAGVVVRPASLEATVKSVVAKVALGEADAGIVYASDVVAARGDVEGVGIPAGQNVLAVYPIAVLAGAADRDAAREFVAFVVSPDAQAILARYGFAPP